MTFGLYTDGKLELRKGHETKTHFRGFIRYICGEHDERQF